MYSVTSNSGSNTSQVVPGSRPTRLLTAAISAAVIMISALLVIAPQRAEAQYGPGQQEVLYSFTGTPDGATPTSGLTFHNGNFYGTTCFGGSSGDASVCNGLNLLSGFGGGTVFELSPNGSGGWNVNIIYSFCSQTNCTDGENPEFAGVIFDQSGNMYGTTFNGGAHGFGVVYELSPSGSTWTEKVLYSFANSPDGANPINGVIMDKAGNIFGTTYAGGSSGNGTVFRLTPSGNSWQERTLGTINSTAAGLSIDSAGNIYGTTFQGIFKLTPGQGGYSAKVIFTFNPNLQQQQGSNPTGTLAIDSSGNVFGTTYGGGAHGLGTVYELVKGTNGGYTQKLLCSFSTAKGNNSNLPFAGVILDPAGNIYGTTTQGGIFNPPGDGTIYELIAASNYQEIRIFSFNGLDGAYPFSPLYMDGQGYLYGTTTYGTNGGSQSDGVLFIVNPHAAVTSITLTAHPNPSKFGQTVTLTATVTSPNGPPPDGEAVVFEPVGQSPMTNGVAQFQVSDLPVGKTVLHAVYEGDLNFLYIKSAPVTQQVNQ